MLQAEFSGAFFFVEDYSVVTDDLIHLFKMKCMEGGSALRVGSCWGRKWCDPNLKWDQQNLSTWATRGSYSAIMAVWLMVVTAVNSWSTFASYCPVLVVLLVQQRVHTRKGTGGAKGHS